MNISETHANNPSTIAKNKQTELSTRFDRLLKIINPDVICDVGSLNGGESLRFRDCVPNAKIFAFEANPLNFNKFRSWLASHRKDISYEYIAIS